jgi:hypothetical protein
MKHVLSIAFVLSISASVHAQPPSPRAEEPLRYDFDDELVAGDYPAPRETLTVSRGRAQRTSLITLRESFVRELSKSVEDL